MKIIVQSPRIGTFQWELPERVNKINHDLGVVLRQEMKLSEEEATLAEKAHNEQIENLIRSYLHLLTGSMYAGAASMALFSMIEEGVSEMATTGGLVVRELRKSFRPPRTKKHKKK